MGAWEDSKRHFDRNALTGVWVRAKDAGKPSPDNLPFVSITFGPSDGDTYTARPESESGKATVMLKRSGANATLTFDAETKDGVKLKGTVECREVVEY